MYNSLISHASALIIRKLFSNQYLQNLYYYEQRCMHHPSLMNAYNSLHQEYSYQYETAQFHTDSNYVQWYTLCEEKLDRRNLKSHQISILYLGYSDDKSAKEF